MIVFSLFVQMSEGATYSVVPFINKKALGSVAGIVGAGGNMGAVAAGFLFRSESLSYPQALLILGGLVGCFPFCYTLLVRFQSRQTKRPPPRNSTSAEAKRREEFKERRAAARPGSWASPLAADGCAANLSRRRAHDQRHLLHHEHGRTGGDPGRRNSDKLKR